jgi:ATP-binding cassette subfamily B protein
MTPNERERMYLTSVMLERDAAKEVRAFQLAPFLRRRYDRLFDERMVELRALARRRTVRSLIGALTSSAVTALAVSALAYVYISDRMSLAATGASVLGLYQLTGRLRTLHFSAASLYEATIFIRDYTSSSTSRRPRSTRAPRAGCSSGCASCSRAAPWC